MDNALFVGLSRQMVLRRELAIIANNVANADTTGFKVEGLLTREEDGAPARNLARRLQAMAGQLRELDATLARFDVPDSTPASDSAPAHVPALSMN